MPDKSFKIFKKFLAKRGKADKILAEVFSMKIFSFTLMIMLMICASAFAEENPPIISVSGEGIVEATPDRAKISVGVVTRAKNPSEVQNSNAKAAANVINAIMALGIERKNISTGNYTFNPSYRHADNGKRILEGYEAANSVTIIVDDLNLVGKVIDAALNHGANQVDSLNFGLRNKNAYQDEALRLAVLDARHKAEIAARALGKSILGVPRLRKIIKWHVQWLKMPPSDMKRRLKAEFCNVQQAFTSNLKSADEKAVFIINRIHSRRSDARSGRNSHRLAIFA